MNFMDRGIAERDALLKTLTDNFEFTTHERDGVLHVVHPTYGLHGKIVSFGRKHPTLDPAHVLAALLDQVQRLDGILQIDNVLNPIMHWGAYHVDRHQNDSGLTEYHLSRNAVWEKDEGPGPGHVITATVHGRLGVTDHLKLFNAWLLVSEWRDRRAARAGFKIEETGGRRTISHPFLFRARFGPVTLSGAPRQSIRREALELLAQFERDGIAAEHVVDAALKVQAVTDRIKDNSKEIDYTPDEIRSLLHAHHDGSIRAFENEDKLLTAAGFEKKDIIAPDMSSREFRYVHRAGLYPDFAVATLPPMYDEHNLRFYAHASMVRQMDTFLQAYKTTPPLFPAQNAGSHALLSDRTAFRFTIHGR